MKKRVFIAMHYMEIGGAEASLIGLLQSLDYSQVEVDLFVYSHQGDFMRLIPQEVNLLPENRFYQMAERATWQEFLRKGYYRLALARFIAAFKRRRYARRHHPIDNGAWFGFTGLEMSKVLPDMGVGEYDLAISYVIPHRYVLDHVRAKRKAAWIHIDYLMTDPCRPVDFDVWSRFDTIVAISDGVRTSFVKVFPELADKTVVIENILSSRFVRERARETEPVEFAASRAAGKTILCSAGRIVPQKNFENIPSMLAELKRLGRRVHWFIVGPGETAPIMRRAQELGVAEDLTFIGPRANPYPYLAGCDLYVQPSLYEGKSVAVREAQILGTCVVITNYPTATDQVKDGLDGVIVRQDNRSIAEGIAAFLDDTEKQRRIRDHLLTHDYGNETEIGRILALVRG